MKLSELNKLALRPVDADFNGLKIVVNINAVTAQYCREAANKINTAIKNAAPPKSKRKKSSGPTTVEIFKRNGREIEELCAVYASLIKGTEEAPLLISWDLTDDQERAIECSEGELRKLHVPLLEDLWNCCLNVERPKRPETRTTATSRTISDNTVASTPIPDTRTDAAPIM